VATNSDHFISYKTYHLAGRDHRMTLQKTARASAHQGDAALAGFHPPLRYAAGVSGRSHRGSARARIRDRPSNGFTGWPKKRQEREHKNAYTEPGPARRARNFAAPELPGEPRAPREKFRARVKPSALMRRTRSKLALPRPGWPVRVDLSRRDFLHVSLDTDLPALRLPVECERRARIATQLAPLRLRASVKKTKPRTSIP
jgi:hypothetical protein